MKSLSASIVIAAGLATLVAGAILRGDFTVLIMGIGAVATGLGFVFRVRSLNQP